MTDGKRVLLVEDEPNILEVLRFLMVREGWHVTAISSGVEAAQIAQDTLPDLVILDLMLPDKSGFDVLLDLRAIEQFAQTPILILTARGQAKDKDLAISSGATEYMTKPFANRDVMLTARRLMGCAE